MYFLYKEHISVHSLHIKCLWRLLKLYHGFLFSKERVMCHGYWQYSNK